NIMPFGHAARFISGNGIRIRSRGRWILPQDRHGWLSVMLSLTVMAGRVPTTHALAVVQPPRRAPPAGSGWPGHAQPRRRVGHDGEGMTDQGHDDSGPVRHLKGQRSGRVVSVCYRNVDPPVN